ncbi:MAG TPA: hypothetical protein VFQ39_16895 [Longimicrobium sp.]|nr:hypothetical protein [Longimicrobium sp.]
MSPRAIAIACTVLLLAGCSREDQTRTDQTLDQAGERVEKAADDAGQAVEKGTHNAIEAARRAGDKVDSSTERLQEQIKEIGSDHPDSARTH